MFDDVRLAHDATAAGAGDLGEVDALFGRQTAGGGRALLCRRRRDRGDHRGRSGRDWRRSGRCRRGGHSGGHREGGGRGFARARGAGGGIVDVAQDVVHRHHIALGLGAANQNTCFQRRNLDRYLVRLQFDQRVARVHTVPFLLEPSGNRGFDDGLTEHGDFDREHCLISGLGRGDTPAAGHDGEMPQ